MKITNKLITGLRTDYNIPDDIWFEESKPFDDEIDSWLDTHTEFLEEFVAFYIYSGIKNNGLWNGSFSGLINSAVDTCCQHYESDDISIEKILNILLNKYNIRTIENSKTIKFEVLK